VLSRISAALVAAVFASVAAPAPAAPADAPVVVQSCSADGYRMTLDTTFTNVSQKVVTNVRLALTTRSDVLAMKDDSGNYAPGEKVSHRLKVDQEYLLMWAKLSCDVAQVTFQDGTSWENTALPPDMVRATRQTPGSNVALSRCYTAPGIRINFTNLAQQDATQVVLGVVQMGKVVWTDSDNGTFAPGKLIERGWDADVAPKSQVLAGKAVLTDLLQGYCVVLGVTYADGTSWENPSPPPMSLGGITIDPPMPSPQDPVTISGCDGSSANYYGSGSWRVDYNNASQKAIVATDLALFMHGSLMAIDRDLHNLAPGDGSRARFPMWDPKFFQPTCVPVSVEFADGTTWLNPAFGLINKTNAP
jgi:hypothetical protein